jgi:hypothetical protein
MVTPRKADVFEIVMLARPRTHFCELAARV